MTNLSQQSGLQPHWLWFRLALVFLTRLPVSIKQQIDEDELNQATGYFAAIGLVIAAVSAGVFYLSHEFLPISVAVVLSIIASLLFTGAFHEDGLADMADGLGGGWQVEDKLNIMKDSRIGTYGACALFMALLLKSMLLIELATASVLLILVSLFIGHSVSRALAVSLIATLEYVQLDSQSKTKPIAQQLTSQSKKLLFFSVTLIFAICYLINVISIPQLLTLIASLFLVRWLFIRFITKQLGGYTGDILGAAQQIFELSIYAILLVMLTETAGLGG